MARTSPLQHAARLARLAADHADGEHTAIHPGCDACCAGKLDVRCTRCAHPLGDHWCASDLAAGCGWGNQHEIDVCDCARFSPPGQAVRENE